MRRVFGFDVLFSILLLIILSETSPAQDLKPAPPELLKEVELPALLKAKPLQEDPKDDELRKLLKARYNEAVAETSIVYVQYVRINGRLDSFIEATQRLLKAGLELHENPTEQVKLLNQYMELTKDAEKAAKLRNDSGQAHPSELPRARYYRLDAEIQLLRAKRQADKIRDK
jgi:hypothetical protein